MHKQEKRISLQKITFDYYSINVYAFRHNMKRFYVASTSIACENNKVRVEMLKD